MTAYYHTYPTCPSCHEPHKSGVPLLKTGKSIYCPSCKVYFYTGVDLLGSTTFRKTVERVVAENNGQGEAGPSYHTVEYLSEFPLPWRIQPNQIEAEYIDWACETPKGKFLVTWPWSSLKFIPLLLSEYLINNPGKRVVVVGRVHASKPRSQHIPFPGLRDAFESLAYLLDATVHPDEDIRHEMRKLSEKHVLKQSKTTQYRIDRRYARSACGGDYPDSLKNSVVTLTAEISEGFGQNALKRTVIKTKKEPQVHEYNSDGFVDLHLQEVMSYRGKLRYRPEWLWDFLLNSKSVWHPHEQFECSETDDGEWLPDCSQSSVFFIDLQTEPKEIFRLVGEINPDLLVIQDSDILVKDRLIGGGGFRALTGYLRKDNDALVLMFSTNPDLRGLYGIHDESGLLRYGVVPHTWDTAAVLENIRSGFVDAEPAYPSPVSSQFTELKPSRALPRIEYRGIECIDALDDVARGIYSLLEGRDEKLAGDIQDYISDLLRSPLYVKGDYTHPDVFKRRNEDGQIMTYDWMINLIRSATDSETYQNLKDQIDFVYGFSTSDCNPLMDEIENQLKESLGSGTECVTAVVHGMDVKGTEKILIELGFQEFMPDMISVCKWGDLAKREARIHALDAGHVIISTLPPPASADYSIYLSNAQRLVYVGGQRYIDKIKLYMEKRLTEQRSRPLYILPDSSPAPATLKRALKESGISSNESLIECMDDMVVEDEYPAFAENPSQPAINVSYKITAGEHAFLILDSRGKAMFVPSGAALLVKDGSGLSEIYLRKNKQDELDGLLKNKQVLVDRHGIYASYRAVFTKAAMFYGRDITFRKAGFEWNGFAHLFEDSISWIIMLKEAVVNCSERRRIGVEEAENKLARYLSTLGLSASDPDYIKSWWTRFETLLTEYGVVYLHNVEHPRSAEDLRKMYHGIKRALPDVVQDVGEADQTYIASIFIQKLRRMLLKRRQDELDPDLYPLYRSLEGEKTRLMERSDTFTVQQVFYVEMANDVEPLRVTDNYKDFVASEYAIS